MYLWNKKKTTKFSINEACAIVYHYLENVLERIEQHLEFDEMLFEKWFKSFSSIKLKILFDREDVYKNIIDDVDPTKGARDIRNEFKESKKHSY